MIRAHFEECIGKLEKELMDMGDLVVQAIRLSMKALQTLDTGEAEKIITEDKQINHMRRDMEHKCINLIATQQPVATDLREIISLLDIVSNLERMGDHAKGIAQIVKMNGPQPLLTPLAEIPQMADKTVDMIRKSLDAFINRDADSATRIFNEDNTIDGLKERVYRELFRHMVENPKATTQATYLIWATHNLERIADRVTNICEQILFLVNG
ncbi:MAG: phosphate signaling complex protein PhoU [bacterium]|nr:phosphate signaling complex protein PhoU [bacterium]